jgi:hypothetical protein
MSIARFRGALADRHAPGRLRVYSHAWVRQYVGVRDRMNGHKLAGKFTVQFLFIQFFARASFPCIITGAQCNVVRALGSVSYCIQTTVV